MANELTISLPSISFAKSTITINIAPSPNPLLVSVTGVHTMHDQFGLTTTAVSFNKGNIGTIGYIYVNNLGAANIQIGSDGLLFPIVVRPGEYAFFRWNAAAFWAKSSAGSPSLEYMFIED